jgi:hypothetical protein
MKLLQEQKMKKRCKTMLNKTNGGKGIGHLALALMILTFLALSIVSFASAQQTGATLTNVSSSTKPTVNPDWNNQSKGYIHTVRLTAEQQNNKWKAYVGNVSSTFVLDDANDYSIYQWNLDSFSGQVYLTRGTTITWGTVSCASEANKITEDTTVSHVPQSADSVNRTFSQRIHNNITVGSTFIGNNTCFSTVTWQNNLNHQLNSSAPFQEVLLWDSNDMLYTVFVENDKVGYRGDGTTYDFQAIVPDDGVGANPAYSYYFYLELR